ncbi:GAF and ANTAR domain-containing protein [Alloalcanivorax gelatiniphagus]
MTDARARLSEFAELAQVLAAAPDENARLQIAVDMAVSLVKRCDHAGITINEKGGVLTRVGSDDLVRRANELQHELGEGPCLDVMRDQDTLVSQDLDQEWRWPLWAKRVRAELSVQSMMSLLVYTDHQSYGALSLYAGQGQTFDADDVAVGRALAGHLAVIMTAEREIAQLGTALAARTVIGQATGVVMALLEVTPDQAFAYLRRVSSTENRKIADLADEIVRTRRLPSEG